MTGRDRYLDGLRAGSLLVVVFWHWALNLLYWGGDDAPHTTNALAYTPGLWVLTWVFQVVPVFFFVGGAVHLRAWRRWRSEGRPLALFVRRRVHLLAVPVIPLLLGWAALTPLLARLYGTGTALGTLELVVSPLWFLAVYLLLVVLLPVTLWLRRRLGVRVLPLLAVVAVAADVAGRSVPAVGWLNVLVVWGLAYQAGLFYDRLTAGSRWLSVGLVAAGAACLVGLVTLAGYPGSMVGVTGDRWSNMAPPTTAIVALLAVQVGLIGLLRPAGGRLVARPWWRTAVDVSNRYALGLFLCHSTGMAGYRYVLWLTTGGGLDPRPPDLAWWLSRPLAVAGPLLFTVPLVYAYARWGGRFSDWTWDRTARPGRAAPTGPAARSG